MKKKNYAKKAAIIALSSVLAAGSLAALAGCGGGKSATKITVHIFCNDSDKQVNQKIMDDWVEEYQKTHDFDFTIERIEPEINNDKEAYFQDLEGRLSNGRDAIADVIYLSPRYVKKYSKLGYVMDLSPYLSAETKNKLGTEIWNNAVSYYGYDKTDANYTLGQSVEYNAASGKFVTSADTSKEVSLYGLPKDYSNFALGYNKMYFTDDLVAAYQTRRASETRNVTNPAASSSKVPAFTGGSSVATFAASGQYNIYDSTGKVVGSATATEGQEAPMLAIGVPVTYKPFNYYIYQNYESALSAGDPIACLVEGLTRGDGFTVTIPGLPGWTFKIEDAAGYEKGGANYAKAVNANSVYDSTIGHTVLTYQEYGALNWAMTYYLNTFNWASSAPDGWKSGYGGFSAMEGNTEVHYVVYGGEQYEGKQGNALYLQPWLAANDGDFLNAARSSALNPDGQDYAGIRSDAYKDKKATTYAGKATETRNKLNLDGTTRNVDVQYGMNTEVFLETYAAFANHGAIWNANAGGAKDGRPADNNSGWDFFRQGRSIFYGAGSWDAATRNDSDISLVNFGQMPSPVSEDYALYTTTATPDYDAGTLVTYANANNVKGTGENAHVTDKAQASNPNPTVYTQAQIYANQILRQDKWAARMDSVGYAANGRFADMQEGDKEYWKKEATASLIAALTVQESEQVSLTYAGAQLPNFMRQCTDFLKYQDTSYEHYSDGAFKDMLTPQGFANNAEYGSDADIGGKIWDYYYKVAKAMADDSRKSSENGKTVAQWVETAGYGDYDGTEKGSSSKALRYDPQYADMKLSEFIGESGKNYYTAMKVLRMVNFSYADRDLNIRMQTGLNAVSDSTMFTPKDDWLNELDARQHANSFMLTYFANVAVSSSLISALQGATPGTAIAQAYSDTQDANPGKHAQWWSPAYYASYYAIRCDQTLKTKIAEEDKALQGK
ncbi:MAG: hypothetical protein HFE28_01860 [Clostridia bacterium]|nr:hypothetical protein [Clostridia bacterium]